MLPILLKIMSSWKELCITHSGLYIQVELTCRFNNISNPIRVKRNNNNNQDQLLLFQIVLLANTPLKNRINLQSYNKIPTKKISIQSSYVLKLSKPLCHHHLQLYNFLQLLTQLVIILRYRVTERVLRLHRKLIERIELHKQLQPFNPHYHLIILLQSLNPLHIHLALHCSLRLKISLLLFARQPRINWFLILLTTPLLLPPIPSLHSIIIIHINKHHGWIHFQHSVSLSQELHPVCALSLQYPFFQHSLRPYIPALWNSRNGNLVGFRP